MYAQPQNDLSANEQSVDNTDEVNMRIKNEKKSERMVFQQS